MKNIALIVNYEKAGAAEAAARLIAALRGRANIYSDTAGAGRLPLSSLEDGELFALCPTVVTLGGDGTIINAAGRCAPYGNVLVGVNLGRLGFLATVEASNAEAAAEFILSDFAYEERTMLKCVIKNGNEQSVHHGLNDVVLSRASGRMLSISAYMDGRLLTRLRADGIALATPTGSTAYSLSAGGPLAAPDMDIFVMSPICPHNLSARAMVLPTDRTIVLEAGGGAVVSVDGRESLPFDEASTACITKSPYVTRLAARPGVDFYELVRKKLVTGI